MTTLRLPEALSSLLGTTDELSHLQEALTHPSFANEAKGGAVRDYQRLEFLGDAVLALAVSHELLRRFPEAQEGELSRRRARVVSTEALAAFARSVELGAALRLGRGADQAAEREQESVLADAVEAVIGAVFLDLGREQAETLCLAVLEHAQLVPEDDRDPKSTLQEMLQAKGGQAPRYELVSSVGPDHQRTFVVCVTHEGRNIAEGSGRTKKAAEQQAARAALLSLEERTE